MVGRSIHSEAERFRDVGYWGVVVADPMEFAAGAGALMPGGAMVNAVSALNKSMGTKAMAEVTRSADQMVASAKSGGFRVTPEAADPIIKVLKDFIERIRTMKVDMEVFDQTPPLGGHDYGKKVAAHMHKVANDDRSARVSLDSLQIALEKSLEALLRASDQYQEREETVQDAFRNLGG